MKVPKEYEKLKSGTLKRRSPPHIQYESEYWGVDGHSDILDQCFNVHGFKNEDGITKTEAVLEHCKPTSLLEIGCAPGSFMREAMACGYSCVGIEPCEKHIPFIKEYSGCEVHHGFFEDIEFLPTFDTIVAMDVLEHVPEPERFVDKAMSLLSSGGRLVLMLPAIYDDGKFDKRQFHPEHIHLFSQKHLKKWLKPVVFDRWVVGHEIVVVEKK